VTSFEPVPAVGTSEDLAGDVETWTGSPPMRALVRAFGGDDDLFPADLATRLAGLDAFSDRWDARNGAERNLATTLELDPDTEELAVAAARALGMVDARPPQRDAYDHVFVLGGLVRACLVRPAYAAALIRSGAVRTQHVTALGGHRPFRGDEFELAARAEFPALQEEFEALDQGVRSAFGLETPMAEDGAESDLPGGRWSVRSYECNAGLQIRVAAAPSSDPVARRADTADTYNWFASTLARLKPGQSLLAVTTAIYVPAQHAAALRMLALPYGVRVETVGVVPGDVLPALAQSFTPSNYLQEVRSAIRAYRQLMDAAGA
jgi:hypothetical protein